MYLLEWQFAAGNVVLDEKILLGRLQDGAPTSYKWSYDSIIITPISPITL